MVQRNPLCFQFALALSIGLAGCRDSETPSGVSKTDLQVSDRATIVVLSQDDFVPDRTAAEGSFVAGLPEELTSRITEKLVNTKRFTPIERSALRRVVVEQRFGQDIASTYLDDTLNKAISAMENVEADTVAVTGNLADYNDLLKDFQDLGSVLGADYVVIGNLEKLTRETSSTEVPFSTEDRSSTRIDVDARVQLRVIEVDSGAVIGATSFQTSLSESVFEGGKAESDLYAIYDELGTQAATRVLDITYPARIVNLEPLVISRGVIDGVAKGDEFLVEREGQEVFDSSGQQIARLTSEIGTVTVIDAQDTVSIVEAAPGTDPDLNDLVENTENASKNSANRVVGSSSSLDSSSGKGLPRLAVGLVRSGSTAKTGEDAQKHTPLFTDTLISKLSETKRFQLIDRQEVDQLLDEQFAQALASGQEMASAMGALQGADYIAYGSLDSSSFLSETEVIQVPGSSRSIEQTRWHVSGNMRIVDARSGDILESRKISVSESPPSGMDQRRILTMLADAYAEQVVLILMNAIYPIKVAAVVRDESVYINRGRDGGLAVGEVLHAFRPGQEIIDPDTGVQLGREETFIGQVTLSEVEAARSKGLVSEGALLGVGDILKRAEENLNKRSSQIQPDSQQTARSGAQIQGSSGKGGDAINKFTLAVGQIRVNTGAKLTGFSSGHVERVRDDLATKLANTNRFQVMERQEVDQLIDEKAFQVSASGGDIATVLGELVGADYLVHGEIANFYIEESSETVAYLEEESNRVDVVAEGVINLVDVHTGAVIGTDKVLFTNFMGDVSDITLLMSSLIDEFTTRSVSKILMRIFPIKVLGQSADGTIFINRGEDAGLVSGALFSVMRAGEEMTDPDTGISFGTADSKIGELQITDVEASRSRAKLTSGSGIAAGDILEPVQDSGEDSETEFVEPDF